jgi:hypothetical protein
VYFICTGGIVYTILHKVPWFKMGRSKDGGIEVEEYFQRNQRNQWAGEGYICSSISKTSSLTLVMIAAILLIVAYNSEKLAKNNSQLRIIMGVCVVGAYLFSGFLISAYQIKADWYGPTFFPPEHYITG